MSGAQPRPSGTSTGRGCAHHAHQHVCDACRRCCCSVVQSSLWPQVQACIVRGGARQHSSGARTSRRTPWQAGACRLRWRDATRRSLRATWSQPEPAQLYHHEADHCQLPPQSHTFGHCRHAAAVARRCARHLRAVCVLLGVLLAWLTLRTRSPLHTEGCCRVSTAIAYPKRSWLHFWSKKRGRSNVLAAAAASHQRKEQRGAPGANDTATADPFGPMATPEHHAATPK